MEVVASAASVAQLLGQAISLIQQITEAHGTVRGYPKRLSDHLRHLISVRDTLYLVEKVKKLQTVSVADQVGKVRDVAQELDVFLQEAAPFNTRSAARQYIHVLASGKQSERELAGILDRLDRARSELVMRIQLTQVDITGTLHDGFMTTRPLIERIDANTQIVLGARPSTTLLSISPSSPEDGQFPPEEEDVAALELDPKLDPRFSSQKERAYIGNVAVDQAQMINGDVGSTTWTQAATGEYKANEARGTSLQVNGRMDTTSFRDLLAARK